MPDAESFSGSDQAADVFAQLKGKAQVATMVIALLLGVGAAALFNALSPHLYASKAVIRVYNPYRLSGSQFGQVDPTTITNLELQYANSPATSAAAERTLDNNGTKFDHVEWTSQTAAATLTVSCFATDRSASMQCAETFADNYRSRRAAAVAQPLDDQVSSLTSQIGRLTSRVTTLQRQVNGTPADQSTDANRGRLAQQEALLTQVSDLTAQRQMLSAQAGTVAQNYQVVVNPKRPDSLATPVTLRNLAVGAFAGLVLGVLVALLTARMRASTRERRREMTTPAHRD